jgi:hypothetical protein
VKTIQELLRDDELPQICAHIGNVIRLAAIIGLEEVEAACRCSAEIGIHAMLLDPAREPQTPAAATQNLRLLEAFRSFRSEISGIAEVATDSPPPTSGLADDDDGSYWNE